MNIEEIVKDSRSKSDICRKLGYHVNGTGLRKVNQLLREHDLDISHFDGGKSKNMKYDRVEKDCPVCGTKFETIKNHKKEKTTCSHACSNTYFRSGISNPNWNDDTYRSTCFAYHEHKCVVCDEDKILDVHHYDGNRSNNSPTNLIPICPTHHRYCHSKYYGEISDKVEEYVKNFKIE